MILTQRFPVRLSGFQKNMALALLPLSLMQANVAIANTSESEASSFALEEIVVTAQRREESAQDVPVAVTAMTGDQLSQSRVFNIENIQAVSPSVTFRQTNNAASTANIQIRGIGTTGNSRSFEGAVGVFIDGVYRSRSGQALSDFLDVQSLQVLRGAQGTLFGKNTSAGALLLTSSAPELGEFNGSVEAGIGNEGYQTLRGVVNVPVGERAAFRLAATTTERDGLYENPNVGEYNDKDSESVKAQFLVEATDDLTVKLTADYSSAKENCCYGSVSLVEGPTRPLVDALAAGLGLQPASTDIEDRESVLNLSTDSRSTDKGITLDVSYDTEMGVLRYLAAKRSYEVDMRDQDADFSPVDLIAFAELFESDFESHEVTFSGDISSGMEANYVIGLYYSDEDLEMGRDIYWGQSAQAYFDVLLAGFGVPAGTANATPGLFALEKMDATAKSQAVFTHWNISLNDQFNLIAGARYSKDEKTGAFANAYFRDPYLDPFALIAVMPGLDYARDYDDSSVSGTLALQYHPNSDAMVYLSYNRGYKSGGVNIDVNGAGVAANPATGAPEQTNNPIFESETIDSYELGAKIDWLDGAARTNAAVFYNDLSDLQVAQFTGLIFTVVNISEAEVYGAEIEQLWRMTESLTLSGGVTYLAEARYADDPVLQHLQDREFGFAPEIAANLALLGDFELTDSWRLTSSLEAIYMDEHYISPDNNYVMGDFTILNASVGVLSEEYGLEVRAWVQNLTDKTALTRSYNTPFQPGDMKSYLNEPRTYGLTLKYSF